MTITEKILQHVQDLPETLKAEVLDFVEYLETKKDKSNKDKDLTEWSAFSLSNAMRGMEEDTPYSLSDLKERFL